jgi:hypothetical protein
MLFRIGIENNVEGRSMAWALEHPGCFAYGATSGHALSTIPEAISEYADWLASRNPQKNWLILDDVELAYEEDFDVYTIDDHFELAQQGYEVNAWFRHDWKPLADQDVAHSLQILEWSRADLLDTVYGLEPSALAAEYPGERWNIGGILKHVAGAEWWYLDRLGLAFPKEDLPREPFSRLEQVRQRLAAILPGLAGVTQVVGVNGEFWSPRKMLRRAAWHERDHTAHIRRLIGTL